MQYDIAKVAALLHRAADLDHMPTMKETKYLLPKPALSVRDIKPPQWVNLVQSSWKEVEHNKPSQAKAQVLGAFRLAWILLLAFPIFLRWTSTLKNIVAHYRLALFLLIVNCFLGRFYPTK